jgi:hypothetical protein
MSKAYIYSPRIVNVEGLAEFFQKKIGEKIQSPPPVGMVSIQSH